MPTPNGFPNRGHTDCPIRRMEPWRRERLELQAEASVFAIVLQDIEDGCLMIAVSSLAVCGWRAHSLQQDGALAEQGRRQDGRPAVPLRETGGGGALETVERAIHAALGLRMRMIEKPFYEPAEGGTDLRDTTVESGPRGVILRRLVEPHTLGGVPTRPPPRPTPAQVRPTAEEAARKAAAAARAAAATAKAAQDDAIAAAAAVVVATREHRQHDTAEEAALRAAHELLEQQKLELQCAGTPSLSDDNSELPLEEMLASLQLSAISQWQAQRLQDSIGGAG